VELECPRCGKKTKYVYISPYGRSGLIGRIAEEMAKDLKAYKCSACGNVQWFYESD